MEPGNCYIWFLHLNGSLQSPPLCAKITLLWKARDFKTWIFLRRVRLKQFHGSSNVFFLNELDTDNLKKKQTHSVSEKYVVNCRQSIYLQKVFKDSTVLKTVAFTSSYLEMVTLREWIHLSLRNNEIVWMQILPICLYVF